MLEFGDVLKESHAGSPSDANVGHTMLVSLSF